MVSAATRNLREVTVGVARIEEGRGSRVGHKGWLLLAGWALIVLLFATQWYAYDLTRRTASPYSYYLGWSSLMWALAPLVFWFARRHPFQSQNRSRSLVLHVVAGFALSTVQVLAEAILGLWRHGHDLTFPATLAHYFGQHLQLYLLTYWSLVAAAQFYHMHTQAYERQLRAAELGSELSKARLEALRTQLQPHFLFNTLHTAVALVHENPDAAEDVLSRLSTLLRASLGEFGAHEVSLRKELEFLECYAGIQQRRFGERLTIEFHVDPRVLDCAVPSLVLQPLVENAIRHDIGTDKENDLIDISALAEDGTLVLEVRNRNSILSDTAERLLARGVGLANTDARLRQLYGQQQAMHLLRLEPRGVCVRLVLPMRHLCAAVGPA